MRFIIVVQAYVPADITLSHITFHGVDYLFISVSDNGMLSEVTSTIKPDLFLLDARPFPLTDLLLDLDRREFQTVPIFFLVGGRAGYGRAGELNGCNVRSLAQTDETNMLLSSIETVLGQGVRFSALG
jgi:hypothetical protein